MDIQHNLPPQPYKKFFGREESIHKIIETLIEGGTFIASIDGIGGIGKTALAYYFCKEKLPHFNKFNYLVWITAKETVFDPFSKDLMIKQIRSSFRGIEELVDTTLSVVGLEDLIGDPFDEKKKFIEEGILKKEKIFYVLDNLESIEDDHFFNYITRDFNKFAHENRDLKVLTTSRKRKKIADFPIEIEGLSVEDALRMLKYLALEYNVKDILNATDHNNIKLIEKVGRVPLGIEFIIGQMTLKKSRGQIYQELQGYPSLEGIKSDYEKKKRLSDIILFSFKNMYETLNDKQQYIFQVITSLIRNRLKTDPPVTVELLMGITDYNKNELDDILETLLDNKLIIQMENNEFSISPMAINFVRQYYEGFGEIEDTIIEKKNKIIKSGYVILDIVDIFLNSVRELINNNEYEEAESKLIKALDAMVDYRVYFELAKVQRVLIKFIKAEDNFKMATELNPKDVKVWYEYINMEDSRGRHNIALQLIEKALEKTNNDISILLQKINILKFRRNFDQMREVIEKHSKLYEEEQRNEELLRLLRNWKNIEYIIIRDDNVKPIYYFEAVDKLVEKESEIDTKIQLLNEALKIAKKKDVNKIPEFVRKIKELEKKIIRDMCSRVKKLNKLFNNKNYEEAKKEARKILSWISKEDESSEYATNALRVLLQILSSEKDYERVIMTFEDYKTIGYADKNCVEVYEKAKREKESEEKQNLISEIMVNIQDCEYNLREIIMWTLDSEEDKLLELVKNKGKEEWITQWQLTKDKSLKKDALLIHYSDLSHVRSILSWIKPEIFNKIDDNSIKYKVKEMLKKIIAYLESYISPERQESFHSRLQLYEKDELNNFLVDTRRLLEEIKKLKDLIR